MRDSCVCQDAPDGIDPCLITSHTEDAGMRPPGGIPRPGNGEQGCERVGVASATRERKFPDSLVDEGDCSMDVFPCRFKRDRPYFKMWSGNIDQVGGCIVAWLIDQRAVWAQRRNFNDGIQGRE